MKPIEFPEQNAILAKDQPEYLPLPFHRVNEPEGRVMSCWELDDEEVELIGRTKRIWLSQMTFGKAPMPLLPAVRKNILFNSLDEFAPVTPFAIHHKATTHFGFWDCIKMLLFGKPAIYTVTIHVDRECHIVNSENGGSYVPPIIKPEYLGCYPFDNSSLSCD